MFFGHGVHSFTPTFPTFRLEDPAEIVERLVRQRRKVVDGRLIDA
jgi:hypothetical protein